MLKTWQIGSDAEMLYGMIFSGPIFLYAAYGIDN